MSTIDPKYLAILLAAFSPLHFVVGFSSGGRLEPAAAFELLVIQRLAFFVASFLRYAVQVFSHFSGMLRVKPNKRQAIEDKHWIIVSLAYFQ